VLSVKKGFSLTGVTMAISSLSVAAAVFVLVLSESVLEHAVAASTITTASVRMGRNFIVKIPRILKLQRARIPEKPFQFLPQGTES
jgi:hypothetical protein